MSNPNYVIDAATLDQALRGAGLDPQDPQDVKKFMTALKALLPAAVGIAAVEASTGDTSAKQDLDSVFDRIKAEANQAPMKPPSQSTPDNTGSQDLNSVYDKFIAAQR